jgi:hypothetical protein
MSDLNRRDILRFTAAGAAVLATPVVAAAQSKKARFTLIYFKMLNLQRRDDEEDMDVTITVNGEVLVNDKNTSYVLHQDYHVGKVKVGDPDIRVVIHAKSQDYDCPDYGTYERKHDLSQAGDHAIVNFEKLSADRHPPDRGGAWVLKYQIDQV